MKIGNPLNTKGLTSTKSHNLLLPQYQNIISLSMLNRQS